MLKEQQPGNALGEANASDFKSKINSADNDFREAFRSGSTNPEVKRGDWFCILAAALGSSLGFPATRSEFVDALAKAIAVDESSTGAFDPAPLILAVDAATAPANLAALQVAQWRQVGPPGEAAQADFERWLFAASQAFDVLITRGFRLPETLRKANVDFPSLLPDGIWKKRAITDAPDDTGLLKQNIAETISGYMFGTLFEAITAPGEIERAYQAVHGRMGELRSGRV